MASDELIRSSAAALINRLALDDITPLDLLDALEPRIALVDPAVNALPTLCFERARDYAKALMKKPMAERGMLRGMPVAIKDLSNVAGVRSTQGSPIFANLIPVASDEWSNISRPKAALFMQNPTPPNSVQARIRSMRFLVLLSILMIRGFRPLDLRVARP